LSFVSVIEIDACQRRSVSAATVNHIGVASVFRNTGDRGGQPVFEWNIEQLAGFTAGEQGFNGVAAIRIGALGEAGGEAEICNEPGIAVALQQQREFTGGEIEAVE